MSLFQGYRAYEGDGQPQVGDAGLIATLRSLLSFARPDYRPYSELTTAPGSGGDGGPTVDGDIANR